MRKIKLNLEQLDVTSFETRAEPFAAGTVAAHLNEEASGPHPTCDPAMETCAQTCGQYSCFGTCVAVLCGGTGSVCVD
jgi:hypothetical protein